MDNDPGRRGGVTPADEVAELKAVLASESFTRAPALARVLDYICGEYFAGRAATLKEYAIAVHALGRREDFNPAEDSSVRVGVSRIRKRLQQYYDGEGSGHRLQIVISNNAYSPEFRLREEPFPEPEAVGNPLPESAGPAAPRPQSVRWPHWQAGVAALVLLGLLGALLLHRARPSLETAEAARPVLPAATGELDVIRLMAGARTPKYVDASGHVWSADQYFQGGEAINRPAAKIQRTLDMALYQQARLGDFSYAIPLKPGTYELHLHFAEILLQGSFAFGGESMRRFHVLVNGRRVLSDFDIALDAPGLQVADERVFSDVRPDADGLLHLQFASSVGRALLSGIEVRPAPAHGMAPVRIVTRYKGHYDREGNFWEADRYSQGGTASLRAVPVAGGSEPGLLASERFGSFSYFIPVATGRYTARLWFAESSFGTEEAGSATVRVAGAKRRRFDVYCNGVALARELDILKEAGGPNQALEKVYPGLRPNAQGKLVLEFVPVEEYATVRAIEIVADGG